MGVAENHREKRDSRHPCCPPAAGQPTQANESKNPETVTVGDLEESGAGITGASKGGKSTREVSPLVLWAWLNFLGTFGCWLTFEPGQGSIFAIGPST